MQVVRTPFTFINHFFKAKTLEACIACANAYGVTDELRKSGYDVKGMGKPLTDYLKNGAKVLTF